MTSEEQSSKINNYLICLVYGDDSHKGHGRKGYVEIFSNLSSHEIKEAYIQGCEKIGLDFQHVMSHYTRTDQRVPQILIEALHKFGYDFNDDALEQCQEEGSLHIDVYGYIVMWLFVAEVGNPLFEKTYSTSYKNIKPDIDIGGYWFA
jgi:hypothetical protein